MRYKHTGIKILSFRNNVGLTLRLLPDLVGLVENHLLSGLCVCRFVQPARGRALLPVPGLLRGMARPRPLCCSRKRFRGPTASSTAMPICRAFSSQSTSLLAVDVVVARQDNSLRWA